MIQELLRKDELLPLFKKYAQGYKEGIALDQPLMTIKIMGLIIQYNLLTD